MSDNSVSKVEKSVIWDAVISSGVLGSSKNQNALFKYLLDVKFKDAGHDLKTKTIAIDVFDRDESFSTKRDSIVRVEMHRLRANLESFNSLSNEFNLTLPKSSYDLSFEIKAAIVKDDEPLPVSKPLRNRVFGAGAMAATALAAFVITGAFPKDQRAADCSALIPNLEISNGTKTDATDSTSLNAYVEQVIRGTASQFGHVNIVKDVAGCVHIGVPGYKLKYSLLEKGEGFDGSLSTISMVDNKIISTGVFSGIFDQNKSQENPEGDLYFDLSRITNDLLTPGSLVHLNAVKQNWDDESIARDYSCLSQMHQSFVSDSDEDFYAGLTCLKQSYANGTLLLDNMGGLAASYLEQVMGNRKTEEGDPFLLAKDIMDRVGEQWIDNPETTTAKIMYDTVRPDYNDQQLRTTLFEAEQAYSSNPNILIEVSRSYGFVLGEWERAVKIRKRMRRMVSSQNNSMFFVDAAFEVMSETSPQGWSDCVKVYSKYSKVSNLLVNACATKYGKPDWVQKTEANLFQLNLKTGHDKEQFLKDMRFESGLIGVILDSEKNTLYD